MTDPRVSLLDTSVVISLRELDDFAGIDYLNVVQVP